ncbi:MAG: DedA family protein [Acidobacteriota bacterium]|nr:DedA family protein [Acidobacteriota bacterium]MDE3189793.1 DedA family protein [Acidobacteriota bacterium]
MTHFVSHYGLWVVFGVVFLEVAGLPFIPGETALITAAALASQGHGSIGGTIALAVLAAVLGAATGYVVGRVRGREILSFWPWLERVTRPGVERSEEFFHRHGSKTVFLGRFLPVLRATIGWMAGVAHMPWPRFLAWNVAGAVAWGCGVGLASYYAGQAVVDAVQRDALIGVGVIVALVLVLVGVHFILRRAERA